MNRREAFAWTATWAVIAGGAAVGVTAMVNTPHHAPLPGCSLKLRPEPALTFHGATVTSTGKWRPCEDVTPLHGRESNWWRQ